MSILMRASAMRSRADALFGDRAAKGDAADQALAHVFQRAFGHADGAHAVMDAARSQAALGNLETASFAQQDIRGRHAHVFKADFAMAVRRVVVAEYRQRAQDGHARRVDRHQDHRLLLVARRFGIGLAHEDDNLAARIAGAGGPPFAAVDDVVVAVAHDADCDVGGIRRGDGRFGHRKGGADLAAQAAVPAIAPCALRVP